MPCAVPCTQNTSFLGPQFAFTKPYAFFRCQFCQWIFSVFFFFSLLNMSSLYFEQSSVFFVPFWNSYLFSVLNHEDLSPFYIVPLDYMLLEGREREILSFLQYLVCDQCLMHDWLWNSLQHWTEWLHLMFLLIMTLIWLARKFYNGNPQRRRAKWVLSLFKKKVPFTKKAKTAFGRVWGLKKGQTQKSPMTPSSSKYFHFCC